MNNTVLMYQKFSDREVAAANKMSNMIFMLNPTKYIAS